MLRAEGGREFAGELYDMNVVPLIDEGEGEGEYCAAFGWTFGGYASLMFVDNDVVADA